MVPSASVLFVSQAGITTGAVESYGVRKRVEAVKNCRRISKHDMKYNGATPKMSVDPETFVRSPFCLMPISWDVLTSL
jgi:urease